ncbi:helix-turn-helix transcriptional regulator [Pseudomonas panipatensis]|uniref:DNA-binding transcriptional regulator, CsgD family n=1 Tax=Pseudomonas panipatensis TaxID=428992 RepID=A0A1G8ENK4_9PSED|nr:helix-turn-helix transcriptional regulator [Pseudomonas panipatensis]SDH71269.1 DNA-binding transcriptional regulator, CsgD family [Pseudomonas panipatensis]SMP68433.1 DNA-binding transcriptional regulator, CsgD family [Pseudomonas panipatensis]
MPSTDLSLDELSRLIDLIYQGADDARPWQRCLERLREALQANYATLILRPCGPADSGLMIHAGAVSNGALGAYGSTYYALDPFVGLPPGEVHTVAEILGEARWRASDFYRQFNAPLDVLHVLGADLAPQHGIECRLRICRPHQAPDFSAADKAFCARLLPHLRRAIRLHGQFTRSETERQLYASAVERLRIGTVILDERHQVLESNRAAAALLAEDDGLSLLDGSLQATFTRDNQALQRLIAQALHERDQPGPRIAEAITLLRPSGRAGLGVLVQSLPRQDSSDGRQPAVVVFLRDPARKASVGPQSLRQLFGFTPAEAALAIHLANGHSLEEAGALLNIRRNTVKAHLRSIFAKAGVNRQSELTYALHSSLAFLCHAPADD